MVPVIACGDLHGHWEYFNKLISSKRPSIVLQCGDFGWWPKLHNTKLITTVDPFELQMVSRTKRKAKWDLYGIKNGDTKIYFCDGNHEDHFSLRTLGKNNEVMPGVFYMKRGSTLTLPDGRVVLFMGGADSIDKSERKPYFDWFPEELITAEDMRNLPDCRIDIVISHTCPSVCTSYLNSKKFIYKDQSRDFLTRVLEKYSPELWYFGHFHRYSEFKFGGTYFYGLDRNDNGRIWWKRIPK